MTVEDWLNSINTANPQQYPDAPELVNQWGYEGQLDIDKCKASCYPYVGLDEDFPELEIRRLKCNDTEYITYRREFNLIVRMCPKRTEIKSASFFTKECYQRFEQFVSVLRSLCFYVDSLKCTTDIFNCIFSNPDPLPRIHENENNGLMQVISFTVEYIRCISKPTLINTEIWNEYPELAPTGWADEPENIP